MRGRSVAAATLTIGVVGLAAVEVGARDSGPSDVAATAEEIHFESEGVTLAGTLWLPEGAGPHPAVVYVHGSGRVVRQSAGFVANRLQPRGVAVFAYDKRGVGDSGGEYARRDNASERNLTLLARDAAAAIAAIREHERIDGEQIGLWGVSQAGWIVPMAAVFDGDVAFTVLLSGPTVTVGEEMYYSQMTRNDRSTRSSLTQEELSARLAERGPFDFDPMPYLRRMEMPGLWLLGAADESIPIPETVALLDELIGEHDRDFSYRLWDGADHGLRVDGRLVPDFWDEHDDFLFGQVRLRGR